MIVFAAASRLRPNAPARRGESVWQPRPRARRFLKNLFDLSVTPATKAALLARCALLVVFALVCHSLGYGAALFVKAAPVSAAIVFGALFVFAATNWLSRD